MSVVPFTLEGFEMKPFTSSSARTRDTGSGPAVVVINEVPGITPDVVTIAQRCRGRHTPMDQLCQHVNDVVGFNQLVGQLDPRRRARRFVLRRLTPSATSAVPLLQAALVSVRTARSDATIISSTCGGNYKILKRCSRLE